MGGFTAGQLFSGGDQFISSDRNWHRWNGATWAAGATALPGLSGQNVIHAILMPGAKTVFFGAVSSTVGPVVVRGAR